MSNKRFLCPACHSPLNWNGSRIIHPWLRKSYAQCSNPFCSSSWTIATEIVSNIAPPSAPFLNPLKSPQFLLHDLALEYIQQHPNCSEDDCVAYLIDRAKANPEDAVCAAEQAMISHRDVGHEVVFDTHKSNAKSAVIKVNNKDYVVPVASLLPLLERDMV